MKESVDNRKKLSLFGLLVISSWVLIVSQASASLLNLGPEELVQANGSDLQVTGCSVPSYVDWNEDGANDLVVGEHVSFTAGKIRVYLNIGGSNDPLFADYFYAQSNGADLTLPAEGCLGCFPRVVDWDDDMRKDLLVGVSNGTIRIYLNTGTDEDPAFDSGTTIRVGTPAVALDVGNRTTPAFADWNGDGLNDLVVGALDARIHIYFNSGSTWPIPAFDFSPSTGQYVQENGHDLIVPSARSSPDVLDLDGDGRKDLLVGNSEGELLLYINVGTDVLPEFSDYLRLESNGVPINLEGALDGNPRSRPFVCDWTSDGHLDVLVGACDGKVHLYQGKAWTTGLGVSSPDLNGDGFIDIEDLITLIEHWGQDNAMCDIAPPPLGDGVVDAMDLELLMSYWGQPFDDPTLIAHWAFDEAEGAIALDSKGTNDGYVFGDPVWQPDGGLVDGAIALDGVDDYILIPPVLNPADGPFSILAWIQGGAPGQAIISEPAGPDWLSLDPVTGHLMTQLTSAARGATPLQSQAFITDGDWHRIGFVWDGLYRTLCVDGIAVAEDTQAGLKSSNNDLYIGTGKDMALGTYWSGLIDDIRIYNRAVSP
ncbi:MAG: FG-GAP-like repeat-containing protein [Planctomycetota bacterium]